MSPKKIIVDSKSFDNLADAARYYNLLPSTVRARLRSGWSINEAFGIKFRERPTNFKKPIVFLGNKFNSLKDRDNYYKLNKSVIEKRIQRGWTDEQAAGIEPPPHRHRNIDGSHRKSNLKLFEEIEGKVFPKTTIGNYNLYSIYNDFNNKEYIGVTTSSIRSRLIQHKYNAKNSNRPAKIYRAMRKYGLNKFKIKLLRNDAKNFKELLEQEANYIKQNNTIKNGYNSSFGGELGTGKTITVDNKVFPSRAMAADYYKIEQTKFNWRLRHGWTPEQAAEIKKWDGAGPKKIKVRNKEFRSIQSAANYFKISSQKVSQRLRSGWSVNEAFGIKKKILNNQPIEIDFDNRKFQDQATFCRQGGFSDALVLKRRKEGWDYKRIWDTYTGKGIKKICKICKNEFYAKRRDKIYCSKQCLWKSKTKVYNL